MKMLQPWIIYVHKTEEKRAHLARLCYKRGEINECKRIFELMKQAIKKWSEDKAGRLAAALSYYSIFSLSPLLVIIVVAVGFFYGEAAVEGRLVSEIEGIVGLEAAQMIQTMIANTSMTEGGIIATVISVVLLIFGATNLFSQIQESLNVVWNVQPKPGIGIAGMARKRLGSLVLVLGVILLLVATLVVTTVITALGDLITDLFLGATVVFMILNWLLSLAIITVLFTLIFKVLPDVKLHWSDVWPGALVTALLFLIGKELIGLYMGLAAAGSAFGAAGSLVVLLLWIFYSAQIFLFGAEFTYLYVKRQRAEIKPAPIAVFLTERERIQQGMPWQETIQASVEAQTGSPLASARDEERSRSHYLQMEDHPGILQKPRTPAQKSMAALTGIVVALIGLVSTALIRSRRG
jgi:membrane protein